MYFPFLTCEVKCSAGALDVADRQNAHTMTLAVRGIVELFRLVKREKDLHREILAFFSLRICSVIDDLPLDLDFEVSQQTEPGESGLPKDLESHSLWP
ncbi:reverse transcriptase protein [Rutstroemia sp. NJR-2017a WRK4]|nr:reverse transcriptase protein [Rutstroemia sp. NJR-2017a WRK4]